MSGLFVALRELLRLPSAASKCMIVDHELKEAIRSRYSGNQQHIRADEFNAMSREANLRVEQRLHCIAAVHEQHNNLETGCSSLHQAVDAAAAGDEVIIYNKNIHIKSGLKINRHLKISCRYPDTTVTIGYGQTILQVGDDELHRIERQPKSLVSIDGLAMKQYGFEAADVPYCLRVSAGAELQLTNCSVRSDRAVGIIVADGTLVMEESQTILCGSHGIMVQEGGNAKLKKCQILANYLPDITDEERKMHEMFIAFCKGESAQVYARRMEVESHSEKEQIRLSGLGKRGTTLDFFEFMEVLKYLKVFPALVTKTEASRIFKEANNIGEADQDSSEIDWIEFKSLMHGLCVRLNRDGFLGVSTENLIPKASDREEEWKAANGIIVRGSNSRLHVTESEFLNCIEGCIVRKGATADIRDCKFIQCGRDRTDAAGLRVTGKGSSATCYRCEFRESAHHGVKAEQQGQIQLHSTTITDVKHQGVLAVGRNTEIVLDGCEIVKIGICGLRANQNGCIQVTNTRITRCFDAGILASFLGTTIQVKGGVTIEGNGAKHQISRGIVAEMEGTVYISGQNDFKDELVAQRHGHIEELNRGKRSAEIGSSIALAPSALPSTLVEDKSTANTSMTSMTSNSMIATDQKTEVHQATTVSKVTKKRCNRLRKPQADRVMHELSKVFDNAAEAFVMLDINAGGGVSIQELDRGFKRLGIEGIDMAALGTELALQSGVELDADSFIHAFMWHGLEIFPESSWQLAFVEASRQRRRIAKRFYDRTGMEHEDNTVLGSNWRSKMVSHEMNTRLKVQQNFRNHLATTMKKYDHRAERKKGVQYVQGGYVFRSKAKYKEGETLSKFSAKHGLPGTPSGFRDHLGRSSIHAKIDSWQASDLMPNPSRSRRILSASMRSLSSHPSFHAQMVLSSLGGEKESPEERADEGGLGNVRAFSRQRFPRTFNPLFLE